MPHDVNKTRCFRYYFKDLKSASGTSAVFCNTGCWNSTLWHGLYHLPTPLRASPTVTYNSTFGMHGAGSFTATTSSLSYASSKDTYAINSLKLNGNMASHSFTNGFIAHLYATSTSTSIEFNSEL